MGSLPEINKEVRNVRGLQSKADEIAKLQFMDRGIDRAIPEILKRKNPTKEFKRLTRIMKDDPQALAGLRKGFYDYALKEKGSWVGKVSRKRLEDIQKKYPAIFGTLYTPQELKMMDRYRKAYDTANLSTKPVGVGPITADKLQNDLDAPTRFVKNFPHILDRRMFLLRQYGEKLASFISSVPKEKMMALLEDAYINPDSAKIFLDMSVGKRVDPLRIAKQLLIIPSQQGQKLTQAPPQGSNQPLGGTPQNTTPKLLKDLLRGKKQ